MNSAQFNKLKLNDQLQTVVRHGTLLHRYQRYNLVCRLYGVQDLYIEVISNSQTRKIISVTAYKELDNIEHIIDEIDISELLKG
jgi:hypothetical protein